MVEEVIYLMKMHKEIIALSIPYYKKGRAGDIEHISWLKDRLFDLERIVKKKALISI